jgi:drug/metabolite transporter (DMT)-like permease
MDDATTAKLMLVLLSFCWGLSWSAMRIALYEVSPWSMRFMGYSIGAATLFALIKLQRRSLVIPYGRAWLHILVASAFIVISFGVTGTFAQLMAETSRVIIVT